MAENEIQLSHYFCLTTTHDPFTFSHGQQAKFSSSCLGKIVKREKLIVLRSIQWNWMGTSWTWPPTCKFSCWNVSAPPSPQLYHQPRPLSRCRRERKLNSRLFLASCAEHPLLSSFSLAFSLLSLSRLRARERERERASLDVESLG